MVQTDLDVTHTAFSPCENMQLVSESGSAQPGDISRVVNNALKTRVHLNFRTEFQGPGTLAVFWVDSQSLSWVDTPRSKMT